MADEKTCPHCGKPVPPTALGDLCPECMLKAGLATQTEGPGGTGPHGTKVIHPPPAPAEIAALFPQLEILESLGRGGMGVVYKARQPRLNRLVALKILAREKEQDAQFAERFTREAQALARLNHPNIVTVHDFGEAGGHCYLVMEFVDGLNLRQLLQTGKIKPEQALVIVPKICEALQYAHEQGIVHRDIKPENILLDKSGRVKIADFGIAKMLGDEPGQQTLTGAKDAVGTPHYMAPEQIEKPLTVDHRADIYSLGVVFYEMLTGELPLGKFQPPSKKVQIDVRLDEVVLHALEKEPDRRYQQASQVKTAVETIVATSPGDAASREGSGAYVTSTQIEAARNRLKIPARGLIAAAVFQLLFALGLLIFAVPAVAHESGDLLGCAVIGIIAAFFMIPAAMVLLGATNMLKLRRHTLIVVASVVAAVAGPGAILGLPFGIWALVILFRPEVRSAFAANRALTRPITPSDSGKMDFALSQVKGPALGLVVAGVLDWVLTASACIVIGFKSADRLFIWLPFLAMALSSCIIYAGLKFMQLERRGAVMLGSVLAMLVSPGNLIGLPLGIWALVVLNRREVREAFEANRQHLDKTTRPHIESSTSIAQNLSKKELLLFGFFSNKSLPIHIEDGGQRRLYWPGVLLQCSLLGLIIIPTVLLTLLMAGWLFNVPNEKLFGSAEIWPTELELVFIWMALSIVMRLAALNLGSTEMMRIRAAQAAKVGTARKILGLCLGMIVGIGTVISIGWIRQHLYSFEAEHSTSVKSDYIGQAWFPKGDSIEITSVERTPDRMVVKGHYQLVSHDTALLALYITTSTNKTVPEDASQRMEIPRGQGDFELADSHLIPGLPHVSMYADGGSFAALYFGTKSEALEESKASWITNASSAFTLQLRLVLPKDSTEPADWLPSASSRNRFQLSRQVLLDDTAIAQAGVDFSPDGRRKIEIRFTDIGAQRFEEITATNIGRQLAIVFRGRVLSAPVIASVIPDGQCQVDGSMNASEVDEIVDCLNRTVPPTAEAWNFSSVRERILPLKPYPDALFGWLDLDSGTVLTNSSLDWQTRAGHEWVRANGLDVVTTESSKNFPTLLGLDTIIAPAPTNGWDIITAADVIHNWTLLQNEPQQKQVFGVFPGQTDTFFFQTREGGKGVLEILGFAGNPPGVKIRYKLVQATAPGEVIDQATGLPTVLHNARIDPNTGLPLPAASATGAAINPTTGLPMSPGETGTIDPVTGLPVPPAAAKGATNAVVAAQKWLALIDNGHYSQSWKEASAIVQGAVTETAWENSMNTFREPLGNLVSREIKSAQLMTEMPGAPDGEYVVMQFQTSFANKKSATETVTFMLEKDGHWKAAGYYIK